MPGVTGMPPDHRRCTATSKRTGERCPQWLPIGWKVCRSHGGNAPQHRAAALKRRAVIELMDEFDRLGTPIVEANPLDVLRDLVREWAGNVVFWRQQMNRLQEAATNESADATFPYKSGTVYEKYSQACDRLAHYGKLAIEAGLDEAETRLVQHQGELIAKALQAYADRMGILNDPRSPVAMRSALTHVAGEIDDAEVVVERAG